MLTLQKTTVKISVKKCISAQSISTSTAVVLRAPIMQPHLWSTNNINSKSTVKQHQAQQQQHVQPQQHNMFRHSSTTCSATSHVHLQYICSDALYTIQYTKKIKFKF